MDFYPLPPLSHWPEELVKKSESELLTESGITPADDDGSIDAIMSSLAISAMAKTEYRPPVVKPQARNFSKTSEPIVSDWIPPVTLTPATRTEEPKVRMIEKMSMESKRASLREWVLRKISQGETIATLAAFAADDPEVAREILAIGETL